MFVEKVLLLRSLFVNRAIGLVSFFFFLFFFLLLLETSMQMFRLNIDLKYV